MLLSITLKTYLLDGMENLYLTGCISFMVLESNISVRYAVTLAIGGEEPLKCIFRNGDTLTA